MISCYTSPIETMVTKEQLFTKAQLEWQDLFKCRKELPNHLCVGSNAMREER